MLICDDCANYFLECSVSSFPIRYGLCELCGNEAHCYSIAIPENKKKTGNDIAADSIREAIRVTYYPDIDQKDGLKLADLYDKEKIWSITRRICKICVKQGGKGK